LARLLAMALWAFAVWVVLTWTRTLEQLAFGAVFAVAVALLLTPVGPVVGPWKALSPRRLIGLLWLLVECAGRIVQANLSLARRIWNPRLPLHPGMVIVPTRSRGDGELTAVGLLTSLIVDNQVVDVDRSRRALLYHAIAVPPGSPDKVRESINGRVEDLLARLR